MKHSRTRGGADRDRAYWEPPGSALQIGARIEEIAVDAPPPTPSSSRDRLLRATMANRRLRAVAVVGTVVTVLTAVLVGPLAQGHARTSPSTASPEPSSSSTASDGQVVLVTSSPDIATMYPPILPTFSDVEAPLNDPPQTPTPALAATGWPVTLPSFSGMVAVGPDGTLYVDDYEPIDIGGWSKSAALQFPDGSYRPPVAFGSDGTAYVQTSATLGYSESALALLWALDSGGQVRPGWPAEIADNSTVLPGPSGTVYILSYNEIRPGITILGPNGETRATLNVSFPSLVCGHAVSPDGTIYLAAAPNPSDTDCGIRVFSAAGRELSGGTVGGWDGLTMADDGTVVAWGFDLQPFGAYVVARTRMAVLGTDGLPLAGWPVTFEGTASAPAFAPDGTMYFTLLGLGNSPSKIVALDRAGVARPGWPVSLPIGFGPFGDARPPVIGLNGTIHCAAVNRSGSGSVLALDPTGAVVPGWPYELPRTFALLEPMMPGGGPANPSPMFVRSPSGGGLLYLVLEDRIVALDEAGRVAPGWPYFAPANAAGTTTWWSFALGTPDGGLVAIQTVSDETGTLISLIRRWTSDGKSPR